jgi:ATP-binding cassette, subfamily B, bacterial
LSLVIYASVLLYYNWSIFLVFFIATIIYIQWFTFFLRKRAILDYKSFSKLAQRQEKNIELIQGMVDIKLNNAAEKKRLEWESLQKEVFDISYASTKISQWQFSGAKIINEIKNIIITFLAAYLVVNNQITIGEMLAISFIAGQLNIPISNIVNFIQEYQDATLSAKRIQDIHYKKDEGSNMEITRHFEYLNNVIHVHNFSFSFNETDNNKSILKNLTFTIPAKKVTAIVGKSGCGKSTLLKVLLKYYEFEKEKITIGDVPFEHIAFDTWRIMVSTVMQDSYIFSDTIANNICLGQNTIDKEKLRKVMLIAQLFEFVYTLPLKENTKVGPNGMQISGGEKQRLLIARALYKNSTYLFLDEATSSLDALTESQIMKGIFDNNEYHKTIIIVAHRLSTIKNADHIIVMDKGTIVETGTHDDLMKNKSNYYNLVQHQYDS